jgi:molybdopterin-guanine dinucleotide biosynthesis protein A
LGNAVIVLAGGLSRRFGQDKCLKELGGKPLVVHVLDRVFSVADELLIVVGSEAQKDALSRFLGLRAGVVVDKYGDHSPLVGALTGFESVRADRVLLLPCDAAFVVPEIASLLLDLCVGRSAVVPRWPNGYVEPLQAAYDVKLAGIAARRALDEGKRDMLGMIGHLRSIRYVSTLVLQQYDEGLTTFHNINTVEDWRKAESMLKKAR